MIAPTPYFADRGCHVQIYEQIRALRKRGHAITLCTYHIGRDMLGADTIRIPRVPWYRKLEAGPSWHKPYLDVLLFLVSLRAAWRVKPDVIHGHLHEGCAIGFLVGRILGIPLLFDYQGSLTGELQAHRFARKTGAFAALLAWSERRINRLADVVVTQTSDMVEKLRRDPGLPEVHLTYDGVNTEDFRPGVPDPALKRSLGIPDGKKVIAYLGILSGYQGVDDLVRAIPAVVGKRPDAFFLIMGYPGVQEYGALARSLGVEGDAMFTGRIDYARAADHLHLADVAVGPKHGETEGDGKIYNYMACGLPMVVSDTRPHRELLADGALYAPEGDPHALAEGILTLLEDPARAVRVAAEARRRAVDIFSWDRVAERLEKNYRLAAEVRARAKGLAWTPRSGSAREAA